jgi:hypothetical protein
VRVGNDEASVAALAALRQEATVLVAAINEWL